MFICPNFTSTLVWEATFVLHFDIKVDNSFEVLSRIAPKKKTNTKIDVYSFKFYIATTFYVLLNGKLCEIY